MKTKTNVKAGVYRITNVRANATATSGSSSGIPSQLVA
jgi:hypothetical protein